MEDAAQKTAMESARIAAALVLHGPGRKLKKKMTLGGNPNRPTKADLEKAEREHQFQRRTQDPTE